MLDVHPPHHPTHTWRDFFIHIATIVVGLIIAVGLEQTVEYVHHRHQALETVEALRTESLENRDIAQTDVEGLRLMIENTRQNREGLRNAPVTHGVVTYQWQKMPEGAIWLPLADSAWLTAHDSATFSMLPPEVVRNRWRVEYTIQEANTQGHDLFHILFQVRSDMHQHGDEVRLSTTERDHLVDELTTLDAAERHVFSTTAYFIASNEIDLQGKDINLNSLRQSRKNEVKPPAY
jgi:hypothetical protein